MRFSPELKQRTKEYVRQKTGKEPEDEYISDFLTAVAKLGDLLMKNASKIQSDI